MTDQPVRLGGLAPTSLEEVTIFAERYLVPEQRGPYVEHYRQGGTLWDWYVEADEATQHRVWDDCLCSRTTFQDLPYAERLEAIAQERARFDAWLAQREMEVDNVR